MPNLLTTLGHQYEIIAGTGIAENRLVTFDGSGNGAVGTHTLFTVTGMVAVKIYAYCTEGLFSNGGTLEVGTSASTAGLVAQTTTTAIDTDEIWHDSTPDQTLELSTVSRLAASGSLTSILFWEINGVAMIKMISKTRITSVNGVMLISATRGCTL